MEDVFWVMSEEIRRHIDPLKQAKQGSACGVPDLDGFWETILSWNMAHFSVPG